MRSGYASFGLEQVVSKGGHTDGADDDAPDREKKPAGVSKQGIGQHRGSSGARGGLGKRLAPSITSS